MMDGKENKAKSTSCDRRLRAFHLSSLTSLLNRAQDGGLRITASNSVHATLAFPATATLHQVQVGIDGFMAKVAETLGVKQTHLFYAGALFSRPKPHAHLILRTPKSRKTRCSISRMPGELKQSLLDFWEESTNGTAKLETVYNLSGLVEYWNGPKNAGRHGQCSLIISSN